MKKKDKKKIKGDKQREGNPFDKKIKDKKGNKGKKGKKGKKGNKNERKS